MHTDLVILNIFGALKSNMHEKFELDSLIRVDMPALELCSLYIVVVCALSNRNRLAKTVWLENLSAFLLS